MYKAKADGKGRLALFDASLHEQLGHKLQLEADLRRAIGEGQLSLAYQPLYQLEPYRLIGFEALARWAHPTRGRSARRSSSRWPRRRGCIEALTRLGHRRSGAPAGRVARRVPPAATTW